MKETAKKKDNAGKTPHHEERKDIMKTDPSDSAATATLLARKRRRVELVSEKNANANVNAKAKANDYASIDHDVPDAGQYQVSYMHRSAVTHLAVSSRHGYVLSASEDGTIKFWKRIPSSSTSTSEGHGSLEFVKSYLSHVGPVADLAVSSNGGDHAATLGATDHRLKVYDVVSFDATGMAKVDDNDNHIRNNRNNNVVSNENESRVGGGNGGVLAFVGRRQVHLAVAPSSWSSTSSTISIYECTSLTVVRTVDLHAAPLTTLRYEPSHDCVLSTDASGNLELWDCGEVGVGSTSANGSDSAINGSDSDMEGMNDRNNNDTDIGSISASPLTPERNHVAFRSKDETDLYCLVKKNWKQRQKHQSNRNDDDDDNDDEAPPPVYALATATSPNHFAVYGSDRKVRIFDFRTAKVVVTYDERLQVYDRALALRKKHNVDAMDYGKRAATEREMDGSALLSFGHLPRGGDDDNTEGRRQRLGLSFVVSGKSNLLLLPTLLGIKVIDVRTNRCIRVVGSEDASNQRFIGAVVCTGEVIVDRQLELARAAADPSQPSSANANVSSSSSSSSSLKPTSDPLLIALAFQKRRLYVFSNNPPPSVLSTDNDVGGRDVLNEAPDPSERWLLGRQPGVTGGGGGGDPDSRLANEAVLRTTLGDVHLQLESQLTPKTVENFCVHARNGYYDNVLFHRVISGFMIQTGDPRGDGTGGESIWGGEFEDEFVRDLRFDRPFVLAMANAGPATNGSQFFITTVPTPWLDNKHTIFGRVTKGMDVCSAIERVKVDDMDKPLDDVTILSIDVS